MSDETKPPAFIIDAPETIDWPVTVTHPVDGGELASFRFMGEFKRLSEEELDGLLGVDVPQDGVGETAPQRMAQVLAENAVLLPTVLIGWKDVHAADRREAPYSVARLAAAIKGPNGPYLSAGLWRALAEIRNGARLGN